MTQPGSSFRRQVVEKTIRVGICIVGLLVLRMILSLLPVFNHAGPIYPQTWSDAWHAAITTSQEPQRLNVLDQKLRTELGDQYDAYMELFKAYITQLQLRPNQLNDPAAALKAYQDWLISSHLAIFPITIARGVIDSLILGLLVFFGLELKNLYRAGYPRFPDLGQILNLSILTIVAAIAYVSYQGLVYPLVGADGQQTYDWIFVVIGLLPLIGIVIMAARNMDRLTALIMPSATATGPIVAGTIACASCGGRMQVGTKFCPNCGAASRATMPMSAGRYCASCGAENPSAAKFCRECGSDLAA